MPAVWVVLAVLTAVVAAALGAPDPGPAGGSTLPTLLGTGVARAGANVAGVACVGLALVGLLLPAAARGPHAAPRQRRDHAAPRQGRDHAAPRQGRDHAAEAVRVRGLVDRGLVALGGGWLVLALLAVVFRAADAFGRPVGTLAAADVLAWATRLSAGRGALLTAAAAGAVLGCAAARLRTRGEGEAVSLRVVLVIALLGMLTPGVTGHAGSRAAHEVAVTTVAVHVAAASLWVGGLGAVLVLLGRRRALLTSVLPRFSLLATYCLVAVTLSGVLTAQVRLGSWAALGTGYGVLVVAKVAALALLGALGLLTRRRLAAGRTPVLRWAGVEVALMAVALGLAAALAQAAT